MPSSSSHQLSREKSDNEVPLLVTPAEGEPQTQPRRSRASSHVVRMATTSQKKKTPAETAMSVLKTIGMFLLQCVGYIVCIPFIGAIYVYGAQKLKHYPDITPDSSDWQSVTVIGIFMQIAVIGPFYCLVQPSFLDRHKPPIADWYGSIIFYCLCALWMERIAYTFWKKAQRRRADLKRTAQAAMAGGMLARQRYQQIEADISLLRKNAQMNSYWAIFVLVVLSGVEVALIRITGTSIDTNETRMTEFYIVMSVFWFLIFHAVNTQVFIGLLILIYQWRIVKSFSKHKRTEELVDIRDSQLVARWCGVWQGIILREVQASPAAKSLTLHGSAFALLSTLITAWYLAFRFLYPKTTRHVEDFHSAALLVLAYEFLATLAYILVTVWMQRSIEAQHRMVATMHHQLVCAKDAARSGAVNRDEDDYQLLEGKTRVVYSLDRLLSTADPRARLFNSSLDSLRWTGVNVGLLFINAFILQIFYAKCVPRSGGQTGPD